MLIKMSKKDFKNFILKTNILEKINELSQGKNKYQKIIIADTELKINQNQSISKNKNDYKKDGNVEENKTIIQPIILKKYNFKRKNQTLKSVEIFNWSKLVKNPNIDIYSANKKSQFWNKYKFYNNFLAQKDFKKLFGTEFYWDKTTNKLFILKKISKFDTQNELIKVESVKNASKNIIHKMLKQGTFYEIKDIGYLVDLIEKRKYGISEQLFIKSTNKEAIYDEYKDKFKYIYVQKSGIKNNSLDINHKDVYSNFNELVDDVIYWIKYSWLHNKPTKNIKDTEMLNYKPHKDSKYTQILQSVKSLNNNLVSE